MVQAKYRMDQQWLWLAPTGTRLATQLTRLSTLIGSRRVVDSYWPLKAICMVVVHERRSMPPEESFRTAYGPINQVTSLSRCDLAR